VPDRRWRHSRTLGELLIRLAGEDVSVDRFSLILRQHGECRGDDVTPEGLDLHDVLLTDLPNDHPELAPSAILETAAALEVGQLVRRDPVEPRGCRPALGPEPRLRHDGGGEGLRRQVGCGLRVPDAAQEVAEHVARVPPVKDGELERSARFEQLLVRPLHEVSLSPHCSFVGAASFATHSSAQVGEDGGKHEGDARPDTLIHLYVRDIDAVSEEFGIPVDEDGLAGRECELVDPDGSRLRVATRQRLP
jgi:hypothetical protein